MLRRTATILVAMIALSLATHALWWQLREHPRSWATADWSSSRMLPSPSRVPHAVVHVMAGRTGRWKGVFAHHTWIVVKPAGAASYTRYDVVGWGRPIKIDGWAADGRWYGDAPSIVTTLSGREAEAAIQSIRASVQSYPFAAPGSYAVWPGPNSNTFIAHIARTVPELAGALLPTAIGKDYTGAWLYAGRAPSRTGIQISLWGLLGVMVAATEGVEINVLGLVIGVDIKRPALKLPGWGRIGFVAYDDGAD